MSSGSTPSTGIAAGSWSPDAFIALDIPTFSGASVGPRLGGDFLYGLGANSPKLRLDVGPRFAFTYNGGDFSLWTLDFLGVGRFSYSASPDLAVYFEGGLGFGYANVSVSVGNFSASDSSAYFSLLFAPGVIYSLSPTMNLIGEVGFWINAKSGLGLHAALPTVGLQWKI